MAAAEALLLERQNTGASYATLVDRLDRTNVLKTLIERDRAKRWRFAGKGSDDHVLALHETLYVLATFCLGLPRDRLPELPLHTQTWLPDLEPKGAAPLDNALLKVMSGARDDHIPALEPDILGEFYVLDYLASPKTQPATAQSVCDAAFSAAGPNAAVFLVRCVADFPERVLALRFLQPALAAGVQAVRNFATACPDLSAFLAREDHWERVDALLEQLATFRVSFQNDREIALQEAKTLFSVIGGAVSNPENSRFLKDKSPCRDKKAVPPDL
jgi:hypothetical protein